MRPERGLATIQDERWAKKNEEDRCFWPREDLSKYNKKESGSDIFFFKYNKEKSEFNIPVFECDKRDKERRKSSMTIFEYNKEKSMTISFSFISLWVTNFGWEKAAVINAKTCDETVRESAISVFLDFVSWYRVFICCDFVTPKEEVGARV